MVVPSQAESSASNPRPPMTCRRRRFGQPHARLPIAASRRCATQHCTSQIVARRNFGSRRPATASACCRASAQNVVQNRWACAHRGSMPTSSMISQKAGCCRWSMAERAAISLAVGDPATAASCFKRGTVKGVVALTIHAATALARESIPGHDPGNSESPGPRLLDYPGSSSPASCNGW
jgi:hypothetical protein